MPLSVSTATGNGTTLALVSQPTGAWLVGDTLLAYVASFGGAPILPVGWRSVVAASIIVSLPEGSPFVLDQSQLDSGDVVSGPPGTTNLNFSLFTLEITSLQSVTVGSPFVLDQSTLDDGDVLASIGQFAFTAPAATSITALVVEYPSALVGGVDRATATAGLSATPTWPSVTPTFSSELISLAMVTVNPGTDSQGTPFTLDQSTLDGTDVLPGQLSPIGYTLDGTSVVGRDFVLDQSTLDSGDVLGATMFLYNFDAQQGAAVPTGAVVAGTDVAGPWCTIGLALLPAQLAVYYIGAQFRFDLIR